MPTLKPGSRKIAQSDCGVQKVLERLAPVPRLGRNGSGEFGRIETGRVGAFVPVGTELFVGDVDDFTAGGSETESDHLLQASAGKGLPRGFSTVDNVVETDVPTFEKLAHEPRCVGSIKAGARFPGGNAQGLLSCEQVRE